ncbi:uncharacterized protein LOC120649124 [Panicum virgatum]|uniref:Uncharacterized protein n=1 Tax=Panicum virgatum TaxID=38727 RepID=A0A8T0N6K7_PANVG|nr:uncharacterized protein LOC120649124 [Panicum virgatum]KAG2544553.1 hypothetical protein PVAP13_9KG009700 [Panicum virgatum]
MSAGRGASHQQQPSCTTVPLGKSVRRALRAAIGMQKKPKDKPKVKPKKPDPAAAGISGSSTELMSSFSKEEAAARKESVVRVVLSSGVVEVYPGVVLACTVIQKHPPGLCLAHPDVFRNPHGAVLRPLEPLFPGQKFLLIPWSTVVKLKHKIPESSIGAFADEEDDTGSDEATSSTETETETEEDYQNRSGGGAAEEERDGSSSSLMPACSAREYFVARDRWSACRFRRLVEQGLAVEPSRDDEPQPDRRKGKARKKQGMKKKKSTGCKKRRERRPAAGPAAAAGLRAFVTPRRRTWEPSLPSVEEEENAVSPVESPAASSGGSESELFPTHDDHA